MKSIFVVLLVVVCVGVSLAEGPKFGARFLKTKGGGAVGSGQIYLNKKDLVNGHVCVNECETDQDCLEESESRKCAYGMLDDNCYVSRCI